MTSFLRYASFALPISTLVLAFTGCDGGANSHRDAGLVTVPSGGATGGSAHSAAGNGGAAQGGAGQGAAGHGAAGFGTNDAGRTDASVLSDASSTNADASDAASCGCVDETVSWYTVGATTAAPHSSLSSCALFTEGYPPGSDAQASCSIDVTDCEGGTGAGAIAQAVNRPGVQAALALAPIFFGVAGNNQSAFRIDVAGKFIDIGAPCPASSTTCVPIPTDVFALRTLLQTFKNEQLRKSPCTELFTRNNETCQIRKTQSSNILATNEHSLAHFCQSPDDCTFLSLTTDCVARCDSVLSKDEVPRVEQSIDNVNTQFCTNFAQDCGPVLIPPCAPPGTLACISNRCVAQ